MAIRVEMIGCLIVVAATLLVGGATAATYQVGDELMWKVPPGGPIAYSTWADQKNFQIGDTIVFNWTGTHDVAEVSQAYFGNCTTSNTIGAVQTTSPVNITLTTNVTRYFICTVSNHCYLGQRVAIGFGTSSASRAIGALSVPVLLLAIAISFLSHL
ncbi:umecyanin-like [Cornus florida]|uniref:umecyanin-like n=1 Tax=Cornus florida TaxID=4283 RepID=UPI002899A0B1|nr:umecyanin-like [Cornus florida]